MSLSNAATRVSDGTNAILYILQHPILLLFTDAKVAPSKPKHGKAGTSQRLLPSYESPCFS